MTAALTTESILDQIDQVQEKAFNVIADLKARIEALQDERDELRDLLKDVHDLRVEESVVGRWPAIGGMPSFEERERRAWRAVAEVFEP